MDAGIGNEKNLALLREKGFNYLVNDRRRGKTEFKDEFAQDDAFTVVTAREGKGTVRVRLTEQANTNDDGTISTDCIVLCKSEPRAAKELAIVLNAEERLLNELNKLAKRIREGRLKDVQKVNRAIGKLQACHPGVQRHYHIDYLESDGTNKASLVWKRNDDAVSSTNELCGC